MISLNTDVLNGASFYFFNIIYGCLLMYTAYRSPWHVLKANQGLQHLCFGAMVLLAVIWSIRADVSTGISIHFMAMTALTLVLGWDLAIVCASAALVITAFATNSYWQNFTANAVLTILIPVAITQMFVYFAKYKLTKNFFVYLFFCGFFCAGLSAMVVGLSVSATLWINDVYPWLQIKQNIMTIIVLTIFPEGLLNGILMTAIMVFYPDWIRSFNAKQYIDDQ
ncbi:energy-coupling factor ABC transporter permease [Gammaproteobacteria bacterium AS21]|jgi:uncharacterized membrane protein